MARLVRQGTLDFIGAARPSIADPFLPQKIEEGRNEDIRECIGCNICVASDNTITPIRCTQNPSMGEEWRKGWHPETIRPKDADGKVLVVGAGPAGLEAAMSAGRRGYDVVLVEDSRELGGRVVKEARLPGLAEWIRVVDYRSAQLDRLKNVECFFESAMSAGEILEYGFNHIAVATGSTWRRDGVGYSHSRPIELDDGMEVLTPDDLMSGRRPRGEVVVIFDDDRYYLGGVLAELLVKEDFAVAYVTPDSQVSSWTDMTLEQHRIQARLMDLGVEIITDHTVDRASADGLVVQSVYTAAERVVEGDSAVFVTSRLPNESLYLDLVGREDAWTDAGLRSVRVVGDALSPGTIATAVWDGRRFAEDLGGSDEEAWFPRDIAVV
jgi:dimethylamine/trimethylamine dehydrogenase